jgi:hypothetical protein
VLFAFCYFVLRALLRIATDDAREREAEILVLRHQLAVLKRSNPRPRLRRRDRMVIAALADLIDRDRWSGFIVSRRRSSAGTGSSSGASGRSGTARLAGRRSIPRWFV